MPYHVEIWPQSSRQQTLGELYAFNLRTETLVSRFISPYEWAEPIAWNGRTLEAGDLSYLKVFETEAELDEAAIRGAFAEHTTLKATREVTNDWITRAAGSRAGEAASAPSKLDDVDWIVELCRRFGSIARQLQRRHSGRPTIQIDDEHDAQDLLHALLLVRFEDVRAESWNPNYLGGASRVDFLVPDAKVVVEVKKTRPGLADRKIGDQLAEDVTRYSDPKANRGASTLVCFVYDPEREVANPKGLETDLASASNERLRVVGVVAQ